MNETKWALITGASSGIGRAIAIELAYRGYNILLHGRNEKDLGEVETEIHEKTQAKAQKVLLDLDSKDLAPLFSACEDKEIRVLVNNAGFGVGGDFCNTDLSRELSMVNVHISAVMKLTKFFLYRMDRNKENYILNVSSLYSFFPVPKQAVYSASKAFTHNFSLALSEELAQSNITVTSLCPGLTYSKFRTRQGKQEKMLPVGMTSQAVAKIAVKQMLKGKVVIVPGLFNKFMRFFIPILPNKIGLKIIHRMNKQRGF
jgi:short-subunit dehydrogenase